MLFLFKVFACNNLGHMGVCSIEKEYTIDKKKMGWDRHSLCAECLICAGHSRHASFV